MRHSVKERVQLAYDAIAINSEHILNHCLDSGAFRLLVLSHSSFTGRQLMVYGWSSLVEHVLTGHERLRSSTSIKNGTSDVSDCKSEPPFTSLVNQPTYVCVLDAWPQQTG